MQQLLRQPIKSLCFKGEIMDKIEFTLQDVQTLVQMNREFALALENVVLKRMIEELEVALDDAATMLQK